jgi:hypothetical protein
MAHYVSLMKTHFSLKFDSPLNSLHSSKCCEKPIYSNAAALLIATLPFYAQARSRKCSAINLMIEAFVPIALTGFSGDSLYIGNQNRRREE